MKTIKFRGKKIDNSEWVYGDLIHNPEYQHLQIGCCLNYPGDGRTEPPTTSYVTLNVISETVGQFTGLQDKNGVDIYSDDVFQKGKDLYLVEYDLLCGFYWRLIYDSWTEKNVFNSKKRSWLSTADSKMYEAIGNIYDNPELLTKN